MNDQERVHERQAAKNLKVIHNNDDALRVPKWMKGDQRAELVTPEFRRKNKERVQKA